MPTNAEKLSELRKMLEDNPRIADDPGLAELIRFVIAKLTPPPRHTASGTRCPKARVQTSFARKETE
jgi:hypothetical protein